MPIAVQYRLLCIGRRAKDPLIEATEGYARRLSHYVKFELVRLRESGLAREASELLAHLKPTDFVVALDERGTALTTAVLATTIRSWQAQGVSRVVFIVGGADGLQNDVKARAHCTWALSGLTLPHRAAQMLLVEQLYRAHSILRGEKYHRA